MKKVLLALLAVSLFSCKESEYNKRSWEIKKSEMELDYLLKIYEIRRRVETLRVIDSLIVIQKKRVDSL